MTEKEYSTAEKLDFIKIIPYFRQIVIGDVKFFIFARRINGLCYKRVFYVGIRDNDNNSNGDGFNVELIRNSYIPHVLKFNFFHYLFKVLIIQLKHQNKTIQTEI